MVGLKYNKFTYEKSSRLTPLSSDQQDIELKQKRFEITPKPLLLMPYCK